MCLQCILFVVSFYKNYPHNFLVNVRVVFTCSPVNKSMAHAKIHTTKLHNPPGTNVKYPCPKYWCSNNGKDYFILAAGGEDKLGVLAYNFDADKWELWCDYPENVNPECAISTIDEKSNLLYLSHGLDPLLAILDLESQEWSVIIGSDNDTYNPLKDPKMVKGQGRARILPNGEYHLVIRSHQSKNQHIRYNPKEERFEPVSQLSINNNCVLEGIALCYIKDKNYLLQLGGIIDGKAISTIWYTDLSKSEPPVKRMIKNTESDDGDDEKDEKLEEWKGDNYIWREHSLKLPFAARSVKIAYAFDRKVIFIFLRKKGGKGESFICDTGLLFIIFVFFKCLSENCERVEFTLICTLIVI